MSMQAMWVNGNTVVPERTAKAEPLGTDGPLTDIPGVPYSNLLGFRQGWGTTFRGKDNHSNWFHFSIPTPAVHEGGRVYITQAAVLYRTDPQVTVTDVHVWDGVNRIFTSPPLTGTSGRHDGERGFDDLREGITKWRIDYPDIIRWGVGISVNVRFSDEGSITFIGAGIDFDVTSSTG